MTALAPKRAKPTVHVNDRSRSLTPAKILEALKGSKCSMQTQLALLALARDASLSYRDAAKAHGVTSTAVYRASRLIPEIRAVRRHRQWGYA